MVHELGHQFGLDDDDRLGGIMAVALEGPDPNLVFLPYHIKRLRGWTGIGEP